MKTHGATSFTKAILLVLLTSAHPSLQDSEYNPSSFSDWNELRSCAQQCLSDGAYSAFADSNLGCSLNGCFCRADIIPQAVSIVSMCVSTSCSDTNDIVSATSFYEAYCASATNTAVISLISTGSVSGTGPDPTTTTPSGPTSTGGSAATPTYTPPKSDGGGGGFTKDQKIALGVGIGIGLPPVLIALIALCVACRRR